MNPPPRDSVVSRSAPPLRPTPTVSLPVAGGAGGDAAGSIRRKTKFAGRRSAAMIAAAYALFGALWIYCSDWVLAASVSDPRRLTLFQDYKGWAFVLGTTVLLYLLLRLTARDREKLEVALRERDECFRLIGENTADVIWVRDLATRRFTFVSPSIRRLLGWTPEEMTSPDEVEIFAPASARLPTETLPRRIAALEAGDESARVQTDPVELQRKDGSTVFADVVTTLTTDRHGRVVGMLGVAREATERRRVEEEMRRIRHWLEHAERIGGTGSWAFDLKNDTVWASPGARRIYGFDDRRITIAEIQRCVLDEFRPVLDQALRALVERGQPYVVEFRIRRASDGTPVDIRSLAEYDPGNRLVIGVIRDVTANKQAADKIREQAELLDKANDAIYATALDGTIGYWNQGAERLFGWTPAEALGRTTADRFSRDPRTLEDQTAVLLQRGNWTGEERQRNKAGAEVVVFTRLTLVRDEHGQPRAVFAISSDITEKRQLETQFLRAQRLESLGALAGGIAHDLNNVLTPVLMAMPLLREENLSAGGRQLLETLDGSVQRGAEIVKQVLTFARGIQGERTPIPPGLILLEAAKMARETFPKNIRVEIRLAEDLGLIMGDATHLHQAVLNLCVNARDAMPEGGDLTLGAQNVVVDERTARDIPGAKPGRYVCLIVTDTGEGIPAELLDRIFEPFFTTKIPGKGTGLGLSAVVGISRSHGGFVRVTSTVGRGSRFELYLPVTDAVRVGADASRITRSPFVHGETILVVDDEVAVCELVRRVLERQGYNVISATGGGDALHLFEQQHANISALVTDMMMPNIDGPTLVQLARKIDPEVRVIGISGAGDRAMLDRIEALGLAGFLAKPFSMEMLLRLLEQVLQSRSGPKTS